MRKRAREDFETVIELSDSDAKSEAIVEAISFGVSVLAYREGMAPVDYTSLIQDAIMNFERGPQDITKRNPPEAASVVDRRVVEVCR